MNDESNALREHVVKYQKAGMKDYFKWSQEAANLMRQAAAQIESLTRDIDKYQKRAFVTTGIIDTLRAQIEFLTREKQLHAGDCLSLSSELDDWEERAQEAESANETLRAKLDAATYTAFIDDPDTLPPSVVKAAQDAICIEFGITGTAGYFKRIIAEILKSLITARSRGETGEKIG